MTDYTFPTTGYRAVDRRLKRLSKELATRAETWGHAYVTESEARLLDQSGLKQPGHTYYRYSVPNEDLSDATQGVI